MEWRMMDLGQTVRSRKSSKLALRHIVLVMHFAVFAAWNAGSGALACYIYDPSFWRAYFFEPADLSHGIDAPVIVEVTITDNPVGPSSTKLNDRSTVVARVERVLKGPIDGKVIKIAWHASSCGQIFRAGDRGIVIGTLDRDSQGAIELAVQGESVQERGIRR